LTNGTGFVVNRPSAAPLLKNGTLAQVDGESIAAKYSVSGRVVAIGPMMKSTKRIEKRKPGPIRSRRLVKNAFSRGSRSQLAGIKKPLMTIRTARPI